MIRHEACGNRCRSGRRASACLGALLALTVATAAHADGRSSTMLVWSGGGNNPSSRTWNGAKWRDVQTVSDVGDEAEWIILADCPKRNETALLTLDGQNDTNFLVYDGWLWGTVTELDDDLKYSTERGGYLAYEQVSGDLLIVYWDDSSSNIGYRTWDGSTLSAESDLTLTSNKEVHFVELFPKPDSDKIMLLAQNDDDELMATEWNGSSWSTVTDFGNKLRYTTEQPWGFAYETLSGDGLVGYNQDNNKPAYRTWNGSSWSGRSDAIDVGKKQHYIRLVADPASDEIIMATLDDSKDLNVQTWNGSSWGSHVELDDNLKERTARYFDVAYEAGGNEALIVYAENGNDLPQYRTWNGSSWSAEASGPDVGDQPIVIQLRTGAVPGEIFIACTDNGSDLNFMYWDGSSMSGNTEIDDSLGGDKENEPFMFARAPLANVLEVVVDPASLTTEEIARRDDFRLWGYQVNFIDEADSAANFDAAVADNHVAYVPEDVSSTTLDTKLRDAPIGVLVEETDAYDEFGLTRTNVGNNTETRVDIQNYSHYITEPFSTGLLTICTSSQGMNEITQYMAPRGQRLADTPGGGRALVALEAGGLLLGGARVNGRRVFMPMGDGAFAWSSLNADGLTLVKRSIEWGRGTMARWKHDESAGTTASDDLDGYDATLTAMSTPGDWVEGRSRRALDFDGLDDRTITSEVFMPPVEGTVSFWIKIPGAPAAQGRIFGIDDNWEVRHNTDGTIIFDLGLSASNPMISTSTLTVANRWYHVVGTYSQIDGTYALYIDGALDKSGAVTLDVPSGDVLSIGTRTGSTDYFEGVIDDLRILNHVVEADEVEGLRAASRPRVVTWAEADPISALGSSGAARGIWRSNRA